VTDPSSQPKGSGLSLTSSDLLSAFAVAVALSVLIALIEVPVRSKAGLRACLSGTFVFYCLVLSFGNVITTLLASLAVVDLPSTLSQYYFMLSAFFGVFGFETILKNTNITMFDRGVLTIQTWIEKALNAAAAAAIQKQEDTNEEERSQLITRLMKLSDQEINTRILHKLGTPAVPQLEQAAKASSADIKLYKVFQLVQVLTPSESTALRRNKG